MEWLERMNRALDYFEENMANEISIDEAARLAMCSTYHFQRMFSFITNIPLAEYIRRRRLTLAAQELHNSHAKVIDIAIKYGYDSPDAFTRAFQKLHGMTPSAAREPGVVLKAYPRISFYLTLKGDQEMEYKIVEREEFNLVGVGFSTSFTDGVCYKEIPKFWDTSYENGTIGRLRNFAGYIGEEEFGTQCLGAALYDYKADGTFRYMLTAVPPSNEGLEEYEQLTVPKMTWAVFQATCKFDEQLDMISIWKRIPEWFQATGYEHAEAPEMEAYQRIDTVTIGDGGFVGEIWIPIIKKQA
jgi:AraC family transcriptional regulator